MPQYPLVTRPDPNPQTPVAGARIIVLSPDFATPYIQQVNLELKRELVTDVSVTSGWLYTKGTRLRRNVDMNLFPPASGPTKFATRPETAPGLISVPYFGGPSARPFPFFDQIPEFKSDNNSVYHAFFVQLRERYSRGLQVLANYTRPS